MDLTDLLRTAVARGASDLHIIDKDKTRSIPTAIA
jgi:type II secretory ATPase GspE/PulE/Tfp pilus assembly ATPase PilB-like protein